MIYFLSLLCSMCIQFAAVDVTPYNMTSLNSENEYIIDEIKERIANNYGGFWYGNYNSYLNVDNEYWIVLKGYYNSQYADKVIVCCPKEAIGSGSSSVYANGYTTYSGENNLVSGVYLGLSNYIGFHYYDQGVDNEMGYYGTPYYNFEGGNFSILYCTRPIYSGETLVVDTRPQAVIWSPDNIGSLGPTGHSSGSSPIDSLINSSINWGSITGHSNGGASGPSPHSSSTHYSSTTPTPDSNDSKTDSLLYMLGNKLADITENTGALGDALGGIMYNQVQGASALFNAISSFNNNVSGVFTPPSKEDFSAMLQTSEIYTSYQNVSSCVSVMTSTLNNVGQQSNYVWEIPLPEAYGGSLSFNFSDYLDSNTLNFIRIIIGAILIISTVVFVAHQFPDIIGGGSGGENA